jgi:CubicO group peptidase (beta-lactamase class C family)
MKAIRRCRTAVVLLALFAAPVAAQDFPSDSSVLAMLQARVDAGGAVGIAVGILESDGSVRTLNAGSAGMGKGAVDAGTVFEIGSISKVFTGILLADMARRGEVSLDDPVEMYLPEGVTVPTRNGAQITLLHLATHRSGLPRMPSNFAPVDPANPYADYTPGQLYEFLSSYELPRDIGAESEYSNLAVGLLGHALSRRLGMSYEEAIRERILSPLGMETTGIGLTPAMQEAMADGHDPGGDAVALWDIQTLEGAGGIRSNVDDMVRFVAANVGEPTTDLERAMRDAHSVREPMGGMEIGLNWITRTTEGQRTVWHNGGTGGFRTFVGFDPDQGTAVVVLTNSSIGADDIGFHLLNSSIPLSPPSLPEFALREAVHVAPQVLERYVGRYQLNPRVVASFELVDGRLRTSLTGQPKLFAYPASETVFFLRAVAAEIEFEVDETGAVTAMTLRQGGQTIRAPRIGGDPR